MIKVAAFRWVPPFAQGLVREFRVRWALEEAGLPYEENFVSFEELKTQDYREKQPFGQIPYFQQDDLTLFESGGIVLYLSENSKALMPENKNDQAHVKSWMFAALNSVEPYVQNFIEMDFFQKDAEGAAARKVVVLESLKTRLQSLEHYMQGRNYLAAERFTGADILMTTVLKALRHTPILQDFPLLSSYAERCQERPAYKKALADHMAPFEKNAPPA